MWLSIILHALIVLYKLLKLAYNKLAVIKILTPKGVSTHTGQQSHIMIELGNAQVGMTSLYVCSLSATVSDLKLVGTPKLMTFRTHLSKFKTHGIMTIDWTNEIFDIMCDGITLTMPTLAYMSLWKYYKISQIQKHSYVVRVLIIYDGLTYLLNGDKEVIISSPTDGIDSDCVLTHMTPINTGNE